MSDTESENESDVDFSASEEDEYIPTDENESESDVDDSEKDVPAASSAKKTETVIRKRKTRNNAKDDNDDEDSDSSVENYLVNPNEIDLASDFFNPNQLVASDAPKFDCNVGLSLSDSEEEIFEAVPSTSQDAQMFDFKVNENFNEKMANLKDKLQGLQAIKLGHIQSDDVDVTKLLAIGEASLVAERSSKSKRKEVNSSDESDLEEVEEDVRPDNVEVRIGPAIKPKQDKQQAEIEASIKRKINRMMKEKQLMMHKVHVLSWIAYGNFVNKILNSTRLMEMVVKFIPSDKCYPKDKTDQKYFESITKWFKTTVGLKTNEQNCKLKCLPPIATSLALQIQSKMAICKKDFVFIFVILLRSMGFQCRLVINLATMSIRPAAKDLCVISTKTADTAKSADKTKKKKPTKKIEESTSSGGKKVKRSKSTLKKANSIAGRKVDMVDKSPESRKTQAAIQSTDGTTKILKRSVSVQSVSTANENKKRSRNDNTNKTKETNAPKSSSSVQNNKGAIQDAPSMTSGSKSAQITKTKVASEAPKPPSSDRTRRHITSTSSAASNATVTSQTIPQLDGGNDKKSKMKYEVKFPLRARSVSASSNQPQRRSISVGIASTPRGRPKSTVSRTRLPSTSKSPVPAIEHNSRKSKFEKTRSNDSPSSKSEKSETDKAKNSKPLKSSSKSPVPTTSKTAQRTLSSSPVKGPSNSKSENLSTDRELKKNIRKPKEKSVEPSTAAGKSDSSVALSPIKRSSRSAVKKLPTEPQAVESIPKDPTKTVAKKLVTKPKARSVSVAKSTKTAVKRQLPGNVSSDNDSAPPPKAKLSKPAPRSESVEKPTNSAVKRQSLGNVSSDSDFARAPKAKLSKPTPRSVSVGKPVKPAVKRQSAETPSSDSDFAPTPKKKSSTGIQKPLPKQVEKLKKRIDRRLLSTDDESNEPSVKRDDMNYWIEVYCEAESKWICVDLFKMKVDCVDDIKKKATKPIAYVFAWNNNNKIKDVSPRYCSQWNTTTRKLRVETDWLAEALSRYKEPLSQRCVAEDRELEEIHAQTPIPTSISELKNHPLYALPRHLLKFEGIYPPNPVPVGFIRDEPIYSRLCVHTLHSREIWVKQARVVNPGEIPYKIVKARPKWDRLANKMLEPLPLEIFGRWQTGPYVPPTAENGIVPRNAYGNVELFKPEMLPKKTVHLRFAGLNRVCAKLKIDCAQAVVGFDFHGGSSHPTFDGFVVCEEFAELVTEKWCEEQEEAYRKSKEKQNQRVYDNWKKLIRGLLIRERLQRKYNFAGKDASGASSKKK